MSFVDRISECARFEPAAYLPFLIAGAAVGLVERSFARRLGSFPDIFEIDSDAVRLGHAAGASAEERTQAVDKALRSLAEEGLIKGWRNEPYPVALRPGGPPLMLMERAAIPLFGVRASGVHLNGFVGKGERLKMWIGRRSLHKATAPGKLDQLVGGGCSALHTIRETLIKECHEEASIPAELAASAKPVGAITYRTERKEGLRRDILYVFDLELPADFVPRINDDEISEFYLWPIERIITTVRDTDEFKFNCSLVIIDFLIRHGFLDHTEPDYLALINGLHAH